MLETARREGRRGERDDQAGDCEAHSGQPRLSGQSERCSSPDKHSKRKR